MGSPVAFGGNSRLTSKDGDTYVLKAGPAHAIERTNSIDEPVYSSPALADGRISSGRGAPVCIGDEAERARARRVANAGPGPRLRPRYRT